ncbi:MAG: S8 family serine peptidase [Phycisphaerales bacterium]|nr:S8 family serine peptidase [Phycisphaerales bacterium]
MSSPSHLDRSVALAVVPVVCVLLMSPPRAAAEETNALAHREAGVAGGGLTAGVIVRAAPHVVPGCTPDGRATFVHAVRAGDIAAQESALADALAGSITGEARAVFQRPRNAALAERVGLTRYYALGLASGADAARVADALARFPALLESAEPVHTGLVCATIPDDPLFGLQWGLHNTGQVVFGHAGTPGADIGAAAAWDLHTGTDAITIAIIDTGISRSHPEFQGRLLAGYNFTSGDSSATDDDSAISHGTQCAGVAAAGGNNGIGMAGVSWGAKLAPVKVIAANGSGTDVAVALGLVWAADQGAQVASLSLGFPVAGGILQSAVSYATASDTLILASTGYQPDLPILLPARYPEVIAVGATDSDDVLAWFTPTGPELDLVAPGVNILTTIDAVGQPDAYILQTGTSMSCAMAAGVAALVRSANPALAAAQVRAILESTADDKGPPGWDPQYGWGRINARAAVEAALGPSVCAGDMNCDGVVDFADIDGFVEALGFPDGAGWPHACPWLSADIDGDGGVTFDDIDPFVAQLGSACP